MYARLPFSRSIDMSLRVFRITAHVWNLYELTIFEHNLKNQRTLFLRIFFVRHKEKKERERNTYHPDRWRDLDLRIDVGISEWSSSNESRVRDIPASLRKETKADFFASLSNDVDRKEGYCHVHKLIFIQNVFFGLFKERARERVGGGTRGIG